MYRGRVQWESHYYYYHLFFLQCLQIQSLLQELTKSKSPGNPNVLPRNYKNERRCGSEDTKGKKKKNSTTLRKTDQSPLGEGGGEGWGCILAFYTKVNRGTLWYIQHKYKKVTNSTNWSFLWQRLFFCSFRGGNARWVSRCVPRCSEDMT